MSSPRQHVLIGSGSAERGDSLRRVIADLGLDSEVYDDVIADPLAQAMILTAIVISMAMTAFILTLAYRQYRYRTADVIEDDVEDAAIAARPATASAAPDHDASDDPETGRMTSEGDSFGPRSFEAPVKAGEDD